MHVPVPGEVLSPATAQTQAQGEAKDYMAPGVGSAFLPPLGPPPSLSLQSPNGNGSSQLQTRPDALVHTASGLSRHTGTKEGQWFKEWEDTIRSCVLNRVTEYDPMTVPRVFNGAVAGGILDGYNE